MSSTSRQNSLLVTQDWKKVYETFSSADFQSYDYETLRKSMIDYLRLYYPEDFNDFIESSEYIALIDAIAFLGQSLAFRTDLNARENFLDTAERRDSILKLARLINYSPKRCIASSGFLKIDSITTTESLADSNGLELSNLVINWNDPTNNNWAEQLSIIFNAALVNSQVIGKPGNVQTINGISNEEYAINLTPNTVATFPFTAAINGSSYNFEAISATSMNQPYLYEIPPAPNGKFNILYRNDNQGNGSNNTGFFIYFKQGIMKNVDFNISDAMPNRVLSVGYDGINNSDVWLYEVTSDGQLTNQWKQVPAVAGVNVIYNKSVDRNLYQINTTSNDQIDLVFGDGSFANIPLGTYRTYFRVSNGLAYKITPDEMQSVSITIDYVSRIGRVETITLRASLKYTVANSAPRETIEEIRQKAPQQYYSQGRMITGEDYNIIPFTSFSNILKVKAVNRTSSGVSRYLDVSDTTGKYSSTNIFAQDGYVYREENVKSRNFTFVSTSNVQQIVQSDLIQILNSQEMQHFYYANFTRYESANTNWSLSSLTTNGSTGYFFDPTNNNILQLGYVTSNNAKYIRSGATIKFSAPTGSYFNAKNNIVSGVPSLSGDKLFIYTAVMQVIGDGTNGGAGKFANGQGPVTLNQKVPNGAIVSQIIPVFKNNLLPATISQVISKVIARNNFALRYDLKSESWQFVTEANINLTDNFSLQTTPPFPTMTVGSPGDISGQMRDASWLIRFSYSNAIGYTIYYRSLDYVFESKLETKFYFDDQVKVYDSQTGTTIRDYISILKVNSKADSAEPLGIDYKWYIYKNIVDIDGYQNQSKVLITFPDDNTDGIPDNPDLFDLVVAPEIDPVRKLVFFNKQVDYTSFSKLVPIEYEQVNVEYSTLTEIQLNSSSSFDNELFYATAENKFYTLTTVSNVRSIVHVYDYVAKTGRGDIMFQYRHNSPGYRRIDPSPNNIIDLYLLTKTYETDYTAWIRDTTNTISKPVPPTTEQLKLEYNRLENVKAISDSMIFNSVKFKPLFGNKADVSLQAIFKVVKNAALNISDNDIKSSVIGAINTYFAIDNWSFGETFYFSELSAYLHTTLSPNVSSIIIVPVDTSALFGSLYQINAEANEIVISSATVDNVEVISSISAATLNARLAGINTKMTIGTV